MAETWSGEKGRFWAEHADWFTRMLGGFIDPLLSAGELRSGERVVDVGCGCGDLTVAAAAAVGPEGSVVGVDVSADELAVTAQRAAEAGMANVDVELGDATTVQLSPPFDVLVSRFGVMFFADPVAAFANLRSLLVEGGRVAFVAWTRPEDNAWFTVPAQAIATVATPAPPPPAGAPGPYAFAEEARVRQVLGDAGFADVRLDELTVDVDLGPDPDAAVAFFRQTDHTRATLDHQPEDVQAAAVEAARAALAEHAGPEGVRLPGLAWLVRART